MHRFNISVPRPDSELPEKFVSITKGPTGLLVKDVLHVLATESGAGPLPDHNTPIAERTMQPFESLWKVHFLISTWHQGAPLGSGNEAPSTGWSSTYANVGKGAA